MSVIQIYRDKHIHKISGEANVSISIACSLSNCRKGRSLGRRHMHARSTKTTAMRMSAIKRVKMFKHCFLPCPFLSHHLALFQTHVSLILHAAATKHVKMTAKTKKKRKRKKERKQKPDESGAPISPPSDEPFQLRCKQSRRACRGAIQIHISQTACYGLGYGICILFFYPSWQKRPSNGIAHSFDALAACSVLTLL